MCRDFSFFFFFLTKHPKLTKAHVLNSRCNLASILMDEVLVVKDSRVDAARYGGTLDCSQSVREAGFVKRAGFSFTGFLKEEIAD